MQAVDEMTDIVSQKKMEHKIFPDFFPRKGSAENQKQRRKESREKKSPERTPYPDAELNER